MKKQSLFIVSLIIFLGLVFGIYQYFQAFEINNVSAVTVGTPNPGHTWAEIECSADILCVDTVNKRLGIGTNTPTKALDVVGDIKSSGDVCNGTGNCLSALASLTNACGGAATTYAYSATAYSGTYCLMGSSTPAAPAWPAQGASTSWTCPVTSGSPISCTATHAAPPVNGLCGPAATTYVYTATAFSGALCTLGTALPAPSFPTPSNSSSWYCVGSGGGTDSTCGATHSDLLVNGAHTSAQCTAAGGTVLLDGSNAFCRFDSGSCLAGMTMYQGWTATYTGMTAGDGCYCTESCVSQCCSHGSCYITGHTWANNATIESCSGTGTGCWIGSGINAYATRIQVGCY
jgi:hypothetical protein